MLAAACATAPRQRATSPDVAGRWDFTVDVGQRVATGEIWLWRRDADFTGTLTTQGANALPVRALTLRATEVAMIVDTPEGPVTFAGTVAGDGATMRGVVTYHEGRRYPLEARRRAAR